MNQRKKLYSILLVACFAGFAWLYNESKEAEQHQSLVGTCLFKHVTDIPCPSCGSTRSILSLLDGNFNESLLINPLGYLIVIIMVFSPLWIILDFVFKRATFLKFYHKLENQLMKPKYALILFVLISINWIWNINKGL